MGVGTGISRAPEAVEQEVLQGLQGVVGYLALTPEPITRDGGIVTATS